MPRHFNHPDQHSPNSSSGRLFIALLGGVFLLMNIFSFGRSWLLEHSSVVTNASVTATHRYHRRGGLYFQADYAFDTGHRHLMDTGDIAAQAYYTLRPGDPIAIRYVPSMPTISETVEMSHYATSVFISVFIGFPASLFILFIAFRGKKLPTLDLSPSVDLTEEIVSTPDLELPNAVTGIAFTVYSVQDMARARKFYETDLGLKLARDVGGQWVEYYLWDSCFALTTMLNNETHAGDEAGARIAFEVTNLDGIVGELRQKGTPIKKEPFSTPTCRMAVVLDPEGNALTLHSRL